MNENKIVSKAIIPEKQLVARPELIKVLSIKPKFVEQMDLVQFHGGLDNPDLEVVGMTRSFIVLRKGDRMVKVHNLDYLLWVKTKLVDEQGLTPKEASERMDRENPLGKIPQLFED